MKVLQGQTIFDLAVQSSGSAEAAYELALQNGVGLTDDLITLSKVCTNRDLRLQLNYHVRENDEDSHVICPGCGTKIIGAAWKKKE